MTGQRRWAVGTELCESGVHVRVWAPDRKAVEFVQEAVPAVPLDSEGNGYFSALIPGVTAGARYRLRLDSSVLAPDPASRFQPEGPHGPSQVIDPQRYKWNDQNWTGRDLRGLVIYEMHIGTFTPEGTWTSAAKELAELAAVGINCVEVMPVADFTGEFGWGYDGVNLFAPTRLYGTPDDFRHFIDTAHRHEIAVLLDVVYNHLGPDGNYLPQFTSHYFTDRHKTDWGSAINFDGEQNGPVREYYLENVAYWISEFHLDGLRLDATQNIYDSAPPATHILTEIGRRARATAPGRKILITTENEPQLPDLCRPEDEGGYGLDGLWNDDFHHSAVVALSGRREAYYCDYYGLPQEFISAVKHGYLYQGQWYSWQQKRRGEPALNLSPAAYITYIQNHDQVANSGRGLRAHQLTIPGRYRAMTALMLLSPGTPMLFQGQEFAASSPFFYFADHEPELSQLVSSGRGEFLAQFPSLADAAMQQVLAPPCDRRTFERCRLDFSERESHSGAYQLTKDLLKLRREDAAFRSQTLRGVDGAVLSSHSFVLRFFVNGIPGVDDRLLIVNLGHDIHLSIVPEPLLAPPRGLEWRTILSTEEAKYGGHGTYHLEAHEHGWRIPGEAAVVLAGAPPSAREATNFRRTQDE